MPNITFALSLIGSFYAGYNEFMKMLERRFNIDIKVVEYAEVDNGDDSIVLIRLQLLNMSRSNLIISHINLLSLDGTISLESEDYSHFLKQINYDGVVQDVFSSDMPIDIFGKTSASAVIMFHGSKLPLSERAIKLDVHSNFGSKVIVPSKTVNKKDLAWFS
jgi:hypothetical protein